MKYGFLKPQLAVFLLCFALAASPARAHRAAPAVFEGEIADSSCAMNVHSLTHSHQEMLKNKYMGNDARSCSQYCVRKMGSEYVLSTAHKDVYRLDDQTKAADFAGQKVVITGSFDNATNTIHVATIEKAK